MNEHLLSPSGAEREKRQAAEPAAETTFDEDSADAYTKLICSDKNPQEYFRFNVQDCRKVIQCTQVVGTTHFSHISVHSTFRTIAKNVTDKLKITESSLYSLEIHSLKRSEWLKSPLVAFMLLGQMITFQILYWRRKIFKN